MGALTVSFLMDLESNMRKITENEYARMATKSWWQEVTRVMPSGSRREIITWLLSTATISDAGLGGNIAFDDMMMLETEVVPKVSNTGLKLRRTQFEDLDGNGVDLATRWAADVAAYAAYWPQKQVTTLLKNGHLSGSKAYDGQPFFSASHPVDGKSSSTTFSNLFTGGSAAPIDDSVSVDVALANLSKVYSSIASIKMPNGSDPRFLRPKGIICGPRLAPRVAQLTGAKTIAQVAGGGSAPYGGGSADVEALITMLGYGKPIQADELAGYESDTTYFVVAEQATSSQLGALVYVDREPYRITYYTGQGGGTGVDAVLDRANELEWHIQGRNVAAYGHPYLLFKCKAA